MSLNQRDRYIIKRIIEYGERTKNTLERFGYSKEKFAEDNDFRDSCSMKIMQISELSRKLSNEFIENCDGLDWKVIKGVRNFFAHEYDDMDEKMIFNTAKDDIPQLVKILKDYLKEFD